ncbi:MAG TPA: serine/threonine-protein kinase, partial [Elusimicrobiota bacterium]|nr:serine/threonine-protein kinase [Elusimicrobiota bacterium]
EATLSNPAVALPSISEARSAPEEIAPKADEKKPDAPPHAAPIEVLAPDSPAQQVVQAAREHAPAGLAQASLARLFSGASASAPADPALTEALDGVSLHQGFFGRAKLLDASGAPLEVLGSGQFGVVHRSATRSDIVLKTLDPVANLVWVPLQPGELLKDEIEVSQALSDSGAGPRFFGHAVVGGRHVFGKEGIEGKTLRDLIDARRYGAKEHQLVLELLERMARARLVPDDMRTVNIMIGTTPSDPAPRAYLIDAVKDKVEGSSVAELRRLGRYDAAARGLADALLRRAGQPPLAEGEDPRASRIMVGTIQRDSWAPKARFVDENRNALLFRPDLTLDEAREALRKNPTFAKAVGNAFAPDMIYIPFEEHLRRGLERSAPKRWFWRLWEGISEAFLNANFPAK